MALTSQIEYATRTHRRPVGDSGHSTEILLAMPLQHWSKEESDRVQRRDRREAGVTVADWFLAHPCELDPDRGVTTCNHPDHQRDAENVREMLDALSLLDQSEQPQQEPAGTKTCSRCRKLKPYAAFSPRTGASGGRRNYCRECHNERRNERRRETKYQHVVEHGKQCSACRIVKPVEEFNADVSQPGGLRYQCKECSRDGFNAARERRKHSTKVTPLRKRCSACGEIKSAEEFGIDNATTTGLATACKPCKNARNRMHRARKRRSA